MKKKYKVVMSDRIKKQIKNLPKEEKAALNDAIKKISENPMLGEPMDIVPFPLLESELCKKCGGIMSASLDKNSREVFIKCPCGSSFWCYEREIIAGRRKQALNNNKNQRQG
jgi:hypothetical protein